MINRDDTQLGPDRAQLEDEIEALEEKNKRLTYLLYQAYDRGYFHPHIDDSQEERQEKNEVRDIIIKHKARTYG